LLVDTLLILQFICAVLVDNFQLSLEEAEFNESLEKGAEIRKVRQSSMMENLLRKLPGRKDFDRSRHSNSIT